MTSSTSPSRASARARCQSSWPVAPGPGQQERRPRGRPAGTSRPGGRRRGAPRSRPKASSFAISRAVTCLPASTMTSPWRIVYADRLDGGRGGVRRVRSVSASLYVAFGTRSGPTISVARPRSSSVRPPEKRSPRLRADRRPARRRGARSRWTQAEHPGRLGRTARPPLGVEGRERRRGRRRTRPGERVPRGAAARSSSVSVGGERRVDRREPAGEGVEPARGATAAAVSAL